MRGPHLEARSGVSNVSRGVGVWRGVGVGCWSGGKYVSDGVGFFCGVGGGRICEQWLRGVWVGGGGGGSQGFSAPQLYFLAIPLPGRSARCPLRGIRVNPSCQKKSLCTLQPPEMNTGPTVGLIL